eukprot:TRINITY_DN3475_c0_g1_i2.p1 TRINITY_DN3475_c0_g1~~TRINITY_DN3475_c0_g1_i2.p1  ORF type:complete len:481 (+),score=140.37 TRINITY_DN3475_c0_g1_i2:50-1444(+)
MSADIGLIGLAVMGENLVLNMESRGYTVAVYNRTTSKMDDFVGGRGAGKKFIGCKTVEDLCKNLKAPRKVMMMVRAGPIVDKLIESIVPFLEKGDIIIDGGNSEYNDSTRRTQELEAKGLLFVGTGVSGGEEGALKGPSMMPGGSKAAWEHVKPIFQSIAAKVEDGSPCCEWVGEEGAGHFVKMVHNGIEYGDMQLICEAYFLLKHHLNLNNEQIGAIFEEWNKGDLDSYLIEITRDIFTVKDEESGEYVLDLILDKAGQKGTGKWTCISALHAGVPLTLIGEAVFARCLSGLKDDRVIASKILKGPPKVEFSGDQQKLIDDIRDALFASKLVSYAQGYTLMREVSNDKDWHLNYGSIALMWRGGCIIRSTFLGKIKEAFDTDPLLSNLLINPFFQAKMDAAQEGWRRVAALSCTTGLPCPTFTSALAYYDANQRPRSHRFSQRMGHIQPMRTQQLCPLDWNMT